jgi:hypothetical protein
VVWDALPVAARAYHGKYARNEVYTLLPPLGVPGRENCTVTPIPGDVCFFGFDAAEIGNPAYGYDQAPKRIHRRARPTWQSSTAATTYCSTVISAGFLQTCSPPSRTGSPQLLRRAATFG